MKKLGIAFILIVFSFNYSFSQKRDIVEYQQNWDKQKIFWGYYLGINMKSYKISYLTDTNTFINVSPSAGFNVGLIGDYRLHKNINLRLEPGLSSNTKELAFTSISGASDSIRSVNSTYLRIPLLLKINTDRYNNIRPYIIGGISYDYNFSSNEDNPDDNYDGEFRMKKSNFTYEVGLGIDIYMPYFIFSPSIRGIFAINDELVRDNTTDSPWTGNVDYFGTRGIFLKLAFH